MGNVKESIKDKYNSINIFNTSKDDDSSINPKIQENFQYILGDNKNATIINRLLKNNLDLFYNLITNNTKNENQAKKLIKNNQISNKLINENIIKNEILNEDNNKNFNDIIEYIKSIFPEIELNEEKINKSIELINSILNTVSIRVKNKFLFLCKLNSITIDAKKNYDKTYNDNIDLLKDNNDVVESKEESKDFQEEDEEHEEDEEEINDNNICNKYTIWNDSKKMENLFNPENIYDFKWGIVANILKIINKNRICISDDNSLYIYEFNNYFNLITKRKFNKYIRYILILKDKNLLICFDHCDEDYLYILNRNKLSIIDKIFLFTKCHSRYSSAPVGLYELANNAIIYNRYEGLSIYNKINGQYIFTKFIVIKGAYVICSIMQITNDYFIITDDTSIQKYSIKDYSMIKFLPSDYRYNSFLKMDNNTIILFYNGCSNIHFFDINKCEIIYKKEFYSNVNEIIPLENNIYYSIK